MFCRWQASKNRGFSMMEYAIIIGIVVTSFTIMNTYIKRGLQGRVKEMTDHFFKSNQQSVESSATAKSSSVSDSFSDSQGSNLGLLGGRTLIISTDSRDVNSQSVVSDTNLPYASPLTSGSAGEQKYAVTHSTTE